MRISRFLLPAVTLAGALALAGCGGDDPMEEMEMETETETETEHETDGFTKADIPTGYTGGATFNTQNTQHVTVVAGTPRAVPGTNVSVSCPSGSCQYRVNSGGEIETTNGATVVLTNPRPSVPPSQAAGHWLTGPSLVGAVNSAGTALDVTVEGVKQSIPLAANTGGDATIAPALHGDEKVTDLRLQHNRDTANARDFLVWGTWKEPVQGTAPDKTHSVASGSMPYKGTPADTLATAVYWGEDDAHIYVNGTYVDGVDVRLDANFGDQTVSGQIGDGITGGAARQDAATLDGLTTGPAGSQFRYITLGATGLGSKINGSKVTIVGLGNSDNNGARLAPSSGTWTAGLYGAGGPATQPTGITGEFSVTRPAAAKTQATAGTPHDRVTKLSVVGAFGAECTTGC